MDNKVMLISIDGVRSDGLRRCGNPYVKELEQSCTHTYRARAVFPSLTFPCHYSMTRSVSPWRHRIFTNVYAPPKRPVGGIFEKIQAAGGVCAMFYGWAPIRDIAAADAVQYDTYIDAYSCANGDTALTDAAERCITENHPDFVFLYMVEADEKGGHDNGWMSDEYLRRISIAMDNVRRMIDLFGDEYTIIVMSDHGGHARTHGYPLPSDMIVPLFLHGPDFAPGAVLPTASLLDIAPTIAAVMGLSPEPAWRGRPLVSFDGQRG